MSDKSKVSCETPRLRPVVEIRKTSFGCVSDDEEDSDFKKTPIFDYRKSD